MDVSNQEPKNSQSGTELLDTVASLTGLPEPLVQKELDQILELTGQASATVTLDTLREAMLAYLETMALSMEGLIEEESTQELAQDLESAEEALAKVDTAVQEADSFAKN